MYLLDLFVGRGERGQCGGTPLDDWANGGYVDVLLTCGEFGFSSLGSWSYSKEWVRNLGTISMLYYFREVKYQQGGTPGF